MAGSHVRVTRFSTVHAHPESGGVRVSYQRYVRTPRYMYRAVPGLGAATPGRVI
jgi:hypothetical protein